MTDYARYSLSFCASAKPGKISEAAFIKRLHFQTLATVWVRWSCYHQISANLHQQFCQINRQEFLYACHHLNSSWRQQFEIFSARSSDVIIFLYLIFYFVSSFSMPYFRTLMFFFFRKDKLCHNIQSKICYVSIFSSIVHL